MKKNYTRLSLLIILLASLFLGEVKSQDCTEVESIFPELSEVLIIEDCKLGGRFCIDIPFDSLPNYSIEVDGEAYTGAFTACDFDTIGTYSYFALFGDGLIGPYFLQSWTVDGTTYSGQFPDIFALVDSMNLWDPNGNWVINDMAQLILGGDNDSNYSAIEINPLAVPAGFTTLSYNDGIVGQGITVILPEGTSQVSITQDATGCADQVEVNAVCILPDLVFDTIFIDSSATVCVSLEDLIGTPTSFENACPDLINNITPSLDMMNFCLDYTGTSVGQDTACLVICDDFVCDTTYVYIDILPNVVPLDTVIYDTIFQGASGTYCQSLEDLGITPESIINNCPDGLNDTVNFTIDEMNFCVDYLGNQIGNDTACIVICDAVSACAMIDVIVTVLPPNVVINPDTILVSIPLGDSIYQYCADLTELPGSPDPNSFSNFCPLSSNDNVSISLGVPDFCIGYQAVSIGQDTVCLEFCDDLGFCDTTIYIIEVTAPSNPLLIIDTINISSPPIEVCLDTTLVPGLIVNATQICPDANGTEVDFVLDTIDYCVTYSPIDLGTDSLCLEICTDLGICDTFTIIITVIEDPTGLPPVAVDDFDSTFINTPIVINVLDNDTINGTLTTVTEITQPENGIATTIMTNQITYEPNMNFCGQDSFVYLICNQEDCDTATVYVFISCDTSLDPTNGFSPNGDGTNDTFVIHGAEAFQQSSVLTIFNRWGNQVYLQEGYLNDWNGQWNGKDLPDGVYWYCFEPGNGEEPLVGWLLIRR